MARQVKCGKCGSVVPRTATNCSSCGLAVGVAQNTVSTTLFRLLPSSARLLGYVSLGAAFFVFSLTRLGFEPVGPEVTLVMAGLCIWGCLLAAAASLIVSAVLQLVGSIPTALSFVAIGIVGASLYWPG